MNVVGNAVGSAAQAAMIVGAAFVVSLAGSWVSGWSVRVPGVLMVRRATGNTMDGVVFDPNAVGLVVLTGLLATLIAAWRPAKSPRQQR